MNKLWAILSALCFGVLQTRAQRTYSSSSVLASGNWYKLEIRQSGVYRIDLPWLSAAGINAAGVSSSSIRLFGNGGAMLSESNSGNYTDDLVENAIMVVDGGDGVFNGQDYILFYADGPDKWVQDGAQSFRCEKNIYSNSSFYFLTIGGNGKRISTGGIPVAGGTFLTTYLHRQQHELDTINFLQSGKEWFGEEFMNAPGKEVRRIFSFNLPHLIIQEPVRYSLEVLARSLSTPSSFTISSGNSPISNLIVPATGSGIYDQFAHRLKTEYSAFSTGENTSLELLFNPGSFNAQGWLSRVTVHGRCQLNFSGQSQFGFREFSGVGPGLFQQFSIAGSPASAQVWDVTNPFEPVRMQGTLNSNSFQFRNDASVLREYVAFTGESFFTPHFVGKVENQNLHAPATPQMLIVTEKSLLPAAQQLASLHQEKDQLESLVVTTEQIFNEFSSGSPDPTAIRNFVKMFYDRAGTDTTLRPKYLLLFGDGSYDYKDRLQGNSNLVPAYQTAESLDPLTTYTSDDYFGFLDDDEDINAPNKLNILDIGIGRIPARNLTEARAMVEKIRTYMSNTSLGPWRNEVIFVADDEDQNLHLEDAEAAAQSLYSNNPTFHPSKIYLDAFLQQSAPGGSRYPDVNRLNNNKITNGTLVWNYNGHGGNRRLAEEVVLDESLLNEWNNAGRNPLLITATCDFAPFDNPSVFSLGEKALLMEKNGAIALMTTTRLVFASSNRVMNSNYLKVAFTRNSDGAYLTLGEAVKEAKNFTYLTSTDIVNNRKFMLLGDPALRLAFPKHQVKTTSINGKAVGANNDTLRAFNKYQIEAEVTDYSGNFLSGFNGTAHVVVYDKPANLTTRGNDPGSIPVEFTAENNIIYKGQSTIKDGRFTCSFIVPGDINFSFDKGSIYYYVEDGQTDGNSVYRNIIVGGVGENSGDDKTGPEIKAWLNDESFVNGSITNENPVLYLKLIDSSGTNISGTGIGHDLVAILDENIEKPFVLNAFYEASKDSYQEGMVRFQFNGLEPGFHRLRIRAWDVVNNSSEITLEFQVVSKEELSVKRVLNYPNPFTTQTSFWFEHNRPAEDLQVQIKIFSISGKLVKTLQSTINSPGFRSSQVTWDGRDEYGQKLARGVYIYILTVRSADGNRSEIIEKLVIL